MQFAHFAQIFPRPGQSAAERYEQLWRELELCDELGFEYGFASVHHLSHLRPPAAAYCTAAAARTRRMRIGPMGYTPALHDPLRVVEEMAVLDNILGGRLEVGLTAGVTRDEFRVYKKDWDNRSAIAAEALQLVHTAFTQPQPFTFNGRYHSYENVCLSVQPLQRPYPPTWLITLAPENLKLAAKMGADTGFLFVSWHRADAAERIREYLRMWKEMGHARQPRVIYETFVYVDKSDEAAREKAAPHIAISLEEIYGGSRSGGGVARAAQMTNQGNNRSAMQTRRNDVALLDERVWVDARVLAQATVSHPAGLDLFQTTMLDDLSGLDPAFDRWLADKRESVTRGARVVAEGVLAAQNEAKGRIAAAERLLFIDRGHEGAWQALIRAHCVQGDRASARLAFEHCVETLAHAGLTPSHETQSLIGSMVPVRLPVDRGPSQASATGGIRLAVLPPRPLDSDGLNGLFVGLAEEITAALSRFRWISSVATGPLATGADGGSLAGPNGQPLDLDFVLDSTVQRGGDRVRVIIRLLDVQSGGQVVWARCFDRELSDALTLQSEIAAETAAQIDPELLLHEAERRNSRVQHHPTAHDFVLRAIPAIYRLEPSGFRAAGETLAAAVALEPSNAAAHAWWAYWHLFLVGQGWAADRGAATLRAGDLAERAVTLDPGDARAMALVGHVRAFLYKRAEEGCALHERALSLNPNLPLAWCFSGLAHSYLGRHTEAIERIAQAQLLSPHDPHAFFFDMALMMPYFLLGEFKTAATVGRRAVELNPGCSSTYKGYLATLGQLGHDREAARILARLLAMEPGFSIKDAIDRSPMIRHEDLAAYAEGLRLGAPGRLAANRAAIDLVSRASQSPSIFGHVPV